MIPVPIGKPLKARQLESRLPLYLPPCGPLVCRASRRDRTAVTNRQGLYAEIQRRGLVSRVEQPHFSPTVRIPIGYFGGLTAPTVPVKLLKLRTESNLGAEGRGFESLRPDHQINHLARSRTSPESGCSENCSGWVHFSVLTSLTSCPRQR
jgi:hypothetical protein